MSLCQGAAYRFLKDDLKAFKLCQVPVADPGGGGGGGGAGGPGFHHIFSELV